MTAVRSKKKRERDTLAMRTPSMAPLAASDDAAAELLHVARVTFIRETAQLLFIRSRDGVSKMPRELPAKAAWTLARDLWDGKPEDC